MPLVHANNIDINYEVQGEGEPQSDAVLTHDATGVLGGIQAPTQVTFGRHDAAVSTRFAGPLTEAIKDSELFVFEDCAHAAIYENVEEFNAKTLAFLNRHSG